MSNIPLDSDRTDFTDIAAAAVAAAETADNATDSDRVYALEQKIANIEPLLEQLQANSNIGLSLSSYVSDLRAEQVFFNRARYAVGCISLLSVTALIILLAAAILSGSSPLFKAQPAIVATFVIGMVSGIVFLLVAFTKGVFRSTAERHSDGFLPPALKKAAEIYGKISGK